MSRLVGAVLVAALVGCGGTADFSLTLVPGSASVIQNGTVATTVNLERAGGFDGEVTVSIADPPPGVSADPITLPKGASVGTLNLTVDASADTTQPLAVSIAATSGRISHTQTLTLTVRGAPGSLDATFAATGQFTYGRDGAAYGVAVQPDGKIVVVGTGTNPTGGGNFVVARFNPDGSHDSGFAGGGTTFVGLSGSCNLVAIQSDGKILVGGTSEDHLAIARLLPDGTPDGSFGSAGTTRVTISPYVDAAVGISVQSDGKIVIGSDSRANGGPSQFAAARLDSTGALDPSFGTGGSVLVPTLEASSSDEEFGFALQPDGKLLLVGASDAIQVPLVVRLGADGNLDPSFNGGGYRTLDYAISGAGQAVAVQPDGKILVVANSGQSGSSHFGVVRLSPVGALDPSFGVNGVTSVQGAVFDTAKAASLLPDGRLAVVGVASDGAPGQIAVTLLSPGGQVDSAFGERFIALGESSAAFAVAPQADGKLVIAGEAYGAPNKLAVARLWQ